MTKRSAEVALRDEVRAAEEEVAARTRVYDAETKRLQAALERRRAADERLATSRDRRDRALRALEVLIPLPLDVESPAPVMAVTDAADGETAIELPLEAAPAKARR